MRTGLLVSLVSISYFMTAAQDMTTNGCYCRYARKQLWCGKSFESRTTSSEEECLAMCTQNSANCRSVNFKGDTKLCELFDVAPAMKRRRRSIVDAILESKPWLRLLHSFSSTSDPNHVTSHWLLRAKRQGYPGPATGCRAGVPEVNECPGNCYYYTPTGKCRAGYGGPQPQPPPSTYSPQPPPTAPPTMPPTRPPTQPRPTPGTTRQPLPAGVQCPSGKQARYWSQKGIQRPQSTSDVSFTSSSEQQCLQACTANQNAGQQVPCKSATFNSQSSMCILSQSTASVKLGQSPQGTQAVYYEKICIDDSIASSCGDLYNKDPQHMLAGYARMVVSAATFGDCLNSCLHSQSLYGFTCSSGMMYSDSSQNCILNSETAQGHPDVYVPETKYPVDYFETGCLGGGTRLMLADTDGESADILKTNNPDWNSWSACDKAINTRYRFLNCKSRLPSTCEDHQEEPCDAPPTKSRAFALAEQKIEKAGDREMDAVAVEHSQCFAAKTPSGEVDCTQSGVQNNADGDGREACVPEECHGQEPKEGSL